MNSGRILGSGAPCLESRRVLFADNSKHSIGSSAVVKKLEQREMVWLRILHRLPFEWASPTTAPTISLREGIDSDLLTYALERCPEIARTM
jgi:hypothetical protein